MAKVTRVWADSVLCKVASWVKIPVETTILRIFKEVSDRQISQIENAHAYLAWSTLAAFTSFRKVENRHTTRPTDWMSIQLRTPFVARQEGSAKGYNPKKKGARSYHPQIAFLAETKEILQAWFRQVMLLRAMVLLNLPNSCWHTYPIGCVLFFEVTVVILWATYLSCWIPGGMAI